MSPSARVERTNGDLGAIVSTHEGRFAAGGTLWFVGPLCLAGGLLAFARGLASGEWSGVLTGVGGLGLGGLVGAALLVYAFSLRRQRLVAHERGFVWTRALRAPRVVRWDEIRGLHTKTTVGQRGAFHTKGQEVELELTLVDGRTLVLTNDLERIEEIRGYVGAQPQRPSPWGA